MTEAHKSLPKWILIVSGLFALMELMVSVSLCFSPQLVLETVDLNAKGVNYVIYMVLLKKKKDYFVAKLGIGYYPYKGENNYSIPFTIGKLYRKNHYFLETGIGAVIYKSMKGRLSYNLTGTLGYRRNFKMNKYYYKIAFTPYVAFKRDKHNKIVVFRDYDINPYVGIGVGKFF